MSSSDKVELTVFELLKVTSLKALLGCKTGKLTEPAGVHQAFKEVDMLILNRHQDEPYLRVKYYYALSKVLAKGGFLKEADKVLRLITKRQDGQFKVPLVILAKVEDLSMKVRIRESSDLMREKDTFQSFLERHNSELQAC